MPGSLPDRRHLLVRGAYVLSMDPSVGELPVGDIVINHGAIVAIGPGLASPGAEVIDGTGMVALPGIVDTHWHLWGTLLRGIVGDGHANGWFARKGLVAPHLQPTETAAGARLALVEGLAAGVTTVHDWAHNVLSPEDADANVEADLATGARVHWTYGAPSTTPGLTLEQMQALMGTRGRNVDEPMDVDDAARVRDAYVPAAEGLLTVGVNVRGPSRSTADVYRHEFTRARDLGLPIAMHCAGTKAEVSKIRQVQLLAGDGLLGPDLLFAHGNHLPPDDIDLIAEHGVSVSASPVVELRLAMGFPQIAELLAAGVRVSLSHDTTAIAACADPFQGMRIALGLEAVRAGNAEALSPRRVIEMATLEGARALGLGEVTGSLTPGKRADLILVRLDALSTAPAIDPAVAVVHSASPATVDTVIVDGRVLKRGGRLTAADPEAVVADARAALRAVCGRAGYEPTPIPPEPATAAAGH